MVHQQASTVGECTMNNIFMQNMQSVVSETVASRQVSNITQNDQRAHFEVTRAYLLYLLEHGRATSKKLVKECRPNHIMPSRALQYNLKNETVLYLRAKNNYVVNGVYEIAPGITAKALGIDS